MSGLVLHGLCAVVLVGRSDGFSERVKGELASTLPCVDLAPAVDASERRTFVRVVTRHRVEIWERGGVAKVLDLDGTDEVDAVKIAEHVHARSIALEAPPASPPESPAAESSPPAAQTPPSPPAESRAPPAQPATATPAPSPSPSHERDTPASSSLSSSPPRFALSAGIGPIVEAGAAGVGARIAARARIAGNFGVGAMTVLPVARPTLGGAQGQAEIATIAVGPTADLELRPSARSAWSGTVGVAVLTAFTRTTGFASAPFVGKSDSLVRIVPAVTGGLAYALSSRVNLDFAAGLGVAAPTIDVRFAGNEVARWGAPYVFGSGGIRIPF